MPFAFNGGRSLSPLPIQFDHRVQRSVLVDRLWPASDSALAHQSLNSLVYSLHKLIGHALGAAAAILHVPDTIICP